ncbi:hypothetical protein XELAEV_18026548mg [Xenopus laevis]|uniref:Protein kinase domain-containing protein n=1 Tax=Xenopus laevis TaxID=8355 RepID=A0A974CUP0_XENLA|nr:hypothetical protein XELAEV_18026548mg [Xenopus laevis]
MQWMKRMLESEEEGAARKKRCERSHHEDKSEKNIKRTSRDIDQFPEECKMKKKRGIEDNDEDGNDQKRRRADPKGPNSQNITSYQLHSLLGQGGFSKVMLATLSDKKPPVAIKILKKRSGRISESILREAKVLQISKESPFLGLGFAAFQTQWHAFLVMEHLSGGSLQDELNSYGSLDIARVRFHSAEVICGLEFLHSRGIVHRDIKPGNIMVDAEGHTKIIDFGLAKMNVFGDNTITGFAGTGGYMAPEIRELKAYNAAVDWWAFGVTVCKMATNKSPFPMESSDDDDDSDSEDEKPILPLWINLDLRDLINKLLRKKPQKRLGVRGNIKAHPFFSTIDWEKLKNQKVPPPFQPRTTVSAIVKQWKHSHELFSH